jgi:hypothetical protein
MDILYLVSIRLLPVTLSENHLRTCRVLRHKVGLRPMSASRNIYINRAPVLTLGAAVVAERLGFDGSTPIDRASA